MSVFWIVTEKSKAMLTGRGKEDSECLATNTTYGHENLFKETFLKSLMCNTFSRFLNINGKMKVTQRYFLLISGEIKLLGY